MRDKDLIKQLRSLSEIRLSSERKFLIKERIFSELEKQSSSILFVDNKIGFFDLFLKAKFASAVFALIVFFASSMSTVAVVGAVRGSLPGDKLYPLKIAIEKTQVGLSANEENKINLRTEFALRRLEELEAVALKKANSTEGTELTEAINNFKKEVSVVKKSLSQLDSSKSKSAQAVFEEKVADKVERKMAELEKKVEVLTSITEKTKNNNELKELSAKAKESFDEAKNSFSNEDFGGAIEKLVISDGIIQEFVLASGSDELLKTE